MDTKINLDYLSGSDILESCISQYLVNYLSITAKRAGSSWL